jgi:hypothetical protein
MVIYMARSDWKKIIVTKGILTGDNSKLHTVLLETADHSVTGCVSIQKWAKYLTAVDKMNGLTKANVPFRPPAFNNAQKISFPAAVIPELLIELKSIYEHAVANKMIKFIPPATEEELTLQTKADIIKKRHSESAVCKNKMPIELE